jgi:hypothetical protein
MNSPRPLCTLALLWIVWGSTTAVAQAPPVITQPVLAPTGSSPTSVGQAGIRRTAQGTQTAPRRLVSLPPPPIRQGTSNPGASSQGTSVPTPAHVPIRPANMGPVNNSVPLNNPQGTVQNSAGLTNLIPPAVAQVLAAAENGPPLSGSPSAVPFPQTSAPSLPPLPNTPLAGSPQTGSGISKAALSAFPPASAVLPTAPSKPTTAAQFPAGQFPAPGAPPTAALVAYGTQPPFANAVPEATPQTEEFPAGRLIAVVGTEHVLAGDMAVFVEPIIEQNRARITNPEDEQKIRDQLTRQVLRQYCEIKAIYQEFFRDMVGTVPPKQLQETKDKVVNRAGRIFFEKQVPVLMEKYEVATIQDLERKLNDKSLSLTTLRSQFVEQVLASELERKYVPDKFEIDRQELLDAYLADKQQNLWNVAGRARWRQLTVRFDKHPSRQEAEDKIRQLGNEIFLGGKSFDAVARQGSEGYTASSGGAYDWTTQGSLKSKELDQALFSLPLNSLSQVIADDIGLHIIEVLEREAGHIKDFPQAQSELRERLSDEKRSKEVRAFRERIMQRTTIWTLWPEDIPDSRPLAAALGIDTDP